MVSDRAAGSAYRARRFWSGAAMVLVIVLVAGACGNGKYRYVTDSDAHTYLKVPSAYAEFNRAQVLDAEAQQAKKNGDTNPSEVDKFLEKLVQWRMSFDSAPVPSVEHIVGFNPEPIIDVRVRDLLDFERDKISTSDLRNLFVPYDELKNEAASDEQSKPLLAPTTSRRFRPITEEGLELAGGLRGVHLVFSLRDPNDIDGKPNPKFYIFNQTALLDAKANRIYVLLVRAGEDEYLRNEKTLSEVTGSFTVKQKV